MDDIARADVATAQRVVDGVGVGEVFRLAPREPAWWDGTSKRPVVALDVDGVVCALAHEPAVEVESWRVSVPVARQHETSFHRGYGRERLETVLSIPVGLRETLAAIAERADMVWATTWEHLAPEVIAPLLGIGMDWPTLYLQNVPFGYHRSSDSPGAKSLALHRIITEAGAGCPVVWVDDNVDWTWELGRGASGRGLGVRTDPVVGWEDSTTEAVGAFLDWAGGPGARPGSVLGLDSNFSGAFVVTTDAEERLEVARTGGWDEEAMAWPIQPVCTEMAWTPSGGARVALDAAEVEIARCQVGQRLVLIDLKGETPQAAPVGTVASIEAARA